MLNNIGLPTLILIIIVALLLFGPSKLPELGRAFGKTLREFKNGAREMMSEEEERDRDRKEVNRSEVNRKDDSRSDEQHRNEKRLPD